MEELLGNEFDDSENQFDKRRQCNDTAAISSDIEKGPVIDSMVPLYEEMEATPQKDTAATTPGLSHSEVIQKYASGTNSPSINFIVFYLRIVKFSRYNKIHLKI